MPVVEALVPAPDPWDAARRLAGWSDLLFLDSSAPLPHLGRFSFVCARPFLRLRSTGGNVTVATPSRRLNRRGDPFLVLQKLLRRYRSAPVPGLPPFQGGAAGLFGYDLCRHIEKVPKPLFADFSWPDLAVNFYGWVLAFDHQTGGAWLITTGFPRRELRAFQALAQRRQGADARRDEWRDQPPSMVRSVRHEHSSSRRGGADARGGSPNNVR